MALKEVSAEKDVDAGDQSINLQPSWLVQAKTARVKLMTKLGGSDSVSAQVDYNTNGGARLRGTATQIKLPYS